MKKFLVFMSLVFVCGIASAETINVNWVVDGDTYAQTSCETGGNFTLPTTPTKYGYHFVGWQQDGSIGYWEQSGTPTPDNPIEPIFRQFGNTVLRAVGSGNNLIADSYDVSTGKITRRIGVKVLDGTETWATDPVGTGGHIRFNYSWPAPYKKPGFDILTNMFPTQPGVVGPNATSAVISGHDTNRNIYIAFPANLLDGDLTTTIGRRTAFNNWLSAQYNAGTPVIIYYPLATPVEEAYNAQ
ncbi:MAG: InlB B-repeat-containing protein [Alphaproteobacteria bacterium]|nr:InlB B-repeat-containing protein [Alphaproteobacteria bacterium]